MGTILQEITAILETGFISQGYSSEYGKVSLSNRPDLCEYQCNGALAAAKTYRKSPLSIAKDVVEHLQGHKAFDEILAVAPGFINIRISGCFLLDFLHRMDQDVRLGCEKEKEPKTIIIDYGGANVAKPLHVGHLRSAVIGESLKRITRFFGNRVIGDVHLGDWGLQMGLIIEEVRDRQPELPYFQSKYQGDFPEEAPFTIGELEEIYPAASAKAKADTGFAERAHQATLRLQNREPHYYALWQQIMEVSMKDLKKNYDSLLVTFDVWKKESDAQPYIPEMIEMLKKKGLAHMSQGALVVDVARETDTKEVPPCIIVKSDGATLYATTDLATLVEREKLFQPDEVLYVVDKRQEMHFEQVFRVAHMAEIVPEDTILKFLGFGTMNGKDGKPFKTREGGVMRLERLMSDIQEEIYKKIRENRTMPEEEARKTAAMIGLAAVKYGDLSNQASKDYIFDVERFITFDGNTGPYILYTIVRIHSLFDKYEEKYQKSPDLTLQMPQSTAEKDLMLLLAQFSGEMAGAYLELAPHKICAYVYALSNTFNRFYHETKILSEEKESRREGYMALLQLTRKVLLQGIELLGFEAPRRM